MRRSIYSNMTSFIRTIFNLRYKFNKYIVEVQQNNKFEQATWLSCCNLSILRRYIVLLCINDVTSFQTQYGCPIIFPSRIIICRFMKHAQDALKYHRDTTMAVLILSSDRKHRFHIHSRFPCWISSFHLKLQTTVSRLVYYGEREYDCQLRLNIKRCAGPLVFEKNEKSPSMSDITSPSRHGITKGFDNHFVPRFSLQPFLFMVFLPLGIHLSSFFFFGWVGRRRQRNRTAMRDAKLMKSI